MAVPSGYVWSVFMKQKLLAKINVKNEWNWKINGWRAYCYYKTEWKQEAVEGAQWQVYCYRNLFPSIQDGVNPRLVECLFLVLVMAVSSIDIHKVRPLALEKILTDIAVELKESVAKKHGLHCAKKCQGKGIKAYRVNQTSSLPL